MLAFFYAIAVMSSLLYYYIRRYTHIYVEKFLYYEESQVT